MTWKAIIEQHNSDGLTMQVRYEREGYAPVPVSVLLPPVGADVQQHIAAYAPLGMWQWEDESRVARDRPPVGLVIQQPQPVAAAPAADQPPAPADPLPTIRLEPVQ